MSGRVRVLAVDDSALMRRFLGEILDEDQGFEVYTARDGEQALARIAELDPDVVTLDVNMPVMDGVTCLSRIMVECPRPVVMVSSLTEEGTRVTLEAMALGAVDYVPKPDGTVSLDMDAVADEIRAKVRTAARARARSVRSSRRDATKAGAVSTPASDHTPRPHMANGAVLVGVSTGGPQTLETILPGLAPDFPLPIIIAQHIGHTFTAMLAERLNGLCSLPVAEVGHPAPLEPGQVLIGRGEYDLILAQRGERRLAMNAPPDDSHSLWHPSANRLYHSALEIFPPHRLIAVQLTGMGDDGAQGALAVRKAGGSTVAEAEDSAVVYGMPRELVEAGGADSVLPAERIADHLNHLVRKLAA